MRPDARSFDASLPIVVVLPVPLTPTTSRTEGRSETPSVGGSPNRSRDLLGECFAELRHVTARLEPSDQLGRRTDADVGVDERLLEPLPRRVVGRIERRDLDLLGERAPRLRERLAQAAEEAALFVDRLLRLVGVTQELCPATRHERGR